MTTWLTEEQLVRRLERPRECYVLPGRTVDGQRVIAIGFEDFVVTETEFLTALANNKIVRMDKPVQTYGASYVQEN